LTVRFITADVKKPDQQRKPGLPWTHLRVNPVVIARFLCDDLNVSRTVLIVDDHPAFRASARELLEDEGFDVVAEADTGESGLALARAMQPDLVLLDVALPDASGLDVAEELAGAPSQVVLVSSRQPADFGARFRESSALGFIPKDRLSAETLEELLE
jgi:DNA-binding NarL/FixJ family response regulator